MMKIEWVNHASFIVEHENIRLITDPWLEGAIFNDGWQLLSETKFKYEDFQNITHIWFSHEHPDHFFPPNIKKIPAEIRKNITVLFQETLDKKVVNFCTSLNFKDVVELHKDKWHNLSPSFKVLCEPFEDDSWLCIKADKVSLLNLNDCVLKFKKDIQYIKNRVGDVDLLFTQFSYANWTGNKEDEKSRIASANEKLDRIRLQVEMLSPKFVVPFASYVWFCHEENFYLNKNINTAEKAFKFIKSNTNAIPVVLYPMDIWTLFEEHNSLHSIESYKRDYNRVNNKATLIKTREVGLVELKNNANEFVKKIKENNDRSIKWYLNPIRIFLTDINKSFQLSLKNGLIEESIPYEECDLALSSESLNYCFKFSWGFNTLSVNGRFQIPPRGNYDYFRKYMYVTSLNNSGKKFNFFNHKMRNILKAFND
jgi:UDP-MurNAc hydroxylase